MAGGTQEGGVRLAGNGPGDALGKLQDGFGATWAGPLAPFCEDSARACYKSVLEEPGGLPRAPPNGQRAAIARELRFIREVPVWSDEGYRV